MAPMTGINVSGHALDRMRQRGLCPDGKHPLTFVYGEVRQALAEGRTAKTQPRWCAGDHERGSGARAPGTLRFVWDEHQQRCYVIKRGIRDTNNRAIRNKRAGVNWTVVTVMGPRAK